jgi:hypothetical protein
MALPSFLDDFFSIDIRSSGTRIAKGAGLNVDSATLTATLNVNTGLVDLTVAAGALPSAYIAPTGSGGTAGLRLGRYDLAPTLGAIPGSLTIANDDGGGDALTIDGSTSIITSTYALRTELTPGVYRKVETTRTRTVTHADSPVTALDGDVIFADSTGGVIAVTVPVTDGSRVEVYRLAATAVTVSCTGLVNGQASVTVPVDSGGYFRADGTNVWAIGA